MTKNIYSTETLLEKYENKWKNNSQNINFDEFLINNSYQIIKDSNVFDEKYYLEKNINISKSHNDPILHYLNYGYKKNYKPNKFFNQKKYVKQFKDEINDLNPFVHYILYNQGAVIGEILNEINKNTINIKNYSNILNAIEKGVTIITPINEFDDNTKNCIESILKNTTVKFNLILIVNKYDDSELDVLLNTYKTFENIRIITDDLQQGLSKNIAEIITTSENDVIILNSDTIVTPRWVQKIIISAYSKEKIATVTPIQISSKLISNIINIHNLNLDSMYCVIEKLIENNDYLNECSNNSCLFIKQEIMRDIESFDEISHLTKQIFNKGWKNCITNSLIYQKITNNFPDQKIIDDLTDKLKNIGSKLNKNLTKKNILYITTISDNIPLCDDIEEISENFNTFILTISDNELKLWLLYNQKFIYITKIRFNPLKPNLNSLNCYYLNLITTLHIDFIFLKFSYTYMFLMKSPFITPIVLSSKIGIPIFYGATSNEIFNPLTKIKENITILSDNILDKNEKGVVYTAIFGNYENIIEPKFINSDLDYVCFTDNPKLKSKTWDIKLIDEPNLDNVRKARKIKTLPHKYLKEYDYSIWVDAGFEIIGDIKEFINRYSTGKPFMSCIHTERNCIYDEAEACILQKKDNSQEIYNQINEYKKNGFPKNWGLIESGVIFRKHNNPKLIKVMEDWYSEILKFSNRDQISLPYVLWKNNFIIDKYRIFYWKNQYFEHYFHQNTNSMRYKINHYLSILINKKKSK